MRAPVGAASAPVREAMGCDVGVAARGPTRLGGGPPPSHDPSAPVGGRGKADLASGRGARSVLFAAGRGERLRPLTNHVPKPALPILDVPLGAFGLAALAATCPPIVVNTCHLAARVQTALEPFAPRGAVEFTVEHPRPLGTAGTLRALRHRARETLVTYNADLLTDLDLGALLVFHRALGARATLAVAPVGRGADLVISGAEIIEFVDRRREDRAGMVFVGVAAFEPSALALLGDDGPAGLAEALIRPLVRRREAAVFVHDGYALDVGTPERYLRATLDVLGGRVPRPVRQATARFR